MAASLLTAIKRILGSIGYTDEEKKSLIEYEEKKYDSRKRLITSVTEFIESIALDYDVNGFEITCYNKRNMFQLWFFPDRVTLIDKNGKALGFFSEPCYYNEESSIKLICRGLML